MSFISISSIGHGGTSTVLSICGFTPLKSKNRKSKKGKLYKEIWKAKLGKHEPYSTSCLPPGRRQIRQQSYSERSEAITSRGWDSPSRSATWWAEFSERIVSVANENSWSRFWLGSIYRNTVPVKKCAETANWKSDDWHRLLVCHIAWRAICSVQHWFPLKVTMAWILRVIASAASYCEPGRRRRALRSALADL